MASEGEDFINQYYVYNRWFLTTVGLWPYDETSKRLRRVRFVIVAILSGIVIKTYTLMKSEFDVNSIMNSLDTYLPALCFMSTYCNAFYNLIEIRKTLDAMKNDWNKVTNKTELAIMKEYANVSRLFCLATACLFYIYAAMLITPSVSCFFLYVSGIADGTELTLPLSNKAFVGNKIHYLVMFPIEIIIIMTIDTSGIAYYTMIILFGQHVCALFNILTMKIEQPFNENICKFYWASPDNKRDADIQWIVEIIEYHRNIFKFVFCMFFLRVVEQGKVVITGSYFIQIMLALFFIVLDFFYLFQILGLSLTIGGIIKNVSYILGTVLMIYAAFYLGQKLIDHSNSVYTKCCLIPFYELSIKTNNLLLLLIMRSIKPCELSLGGAAVASHELFTKIAKTSFSFATIFYNIR